MFRLLHVCVSAIHLVLNAEGTPFAMYALALEPHSIAHELRRILFFRGRIQLRKFCIDLCEHIVRQNVSYI